MRKLLFRLLVVLPLLLLCLASAFIGWISAHPRQIDALRGLTRHYIASYIGAKDIKINSPIVFLNWEEGNLEFEINKISGNLRDIDLTINAAKGAISLQNIVLMRPQYHHFQLRNVHFLMPNNQGDLHIPSLNLEPNDADPDKNHLELKLHSHDKANTGEIIADILFTPKTIIVKGLFTNLPASMMKLITSEADNVSANLNGEFELGFLRNLKLVFGSGKLKSETLRFAHPQFYPTQPIQLKDIDLELYWEKRARFVELRQLLFKGGESRFSFNGKLLLDFSKAELNGEVFELNIAQLVEIWPSAVGVEAKKWVSEHILAGLIEKATININHNRTIKANIKLDVNKAEIEYAKHLPKAYSADGVITITENSLKVDIKKAKSLSNINVENGLAEIPSFTEAAVPMLLNLPIKSDAKDVAIFLSKKHLNKAAELKLNPENIKGEVEGTLKLEFPLYPERAGLGDSSFDNLEFSVAAKIKDFVQDKLLGVWNLDDFAGEIKMDNDKINLSSSGVMQQTKTKLSLQHGFAKKSTNYQFELELNHHNLDKFDIKLPKGWLTGVTLLKGDMQQVGNQKTLKVEANLDKAEINLSDYGWVKPKGKATIVTLVKKITDSQIRIEDLQLKSGDSLIKGNAELNLEGELKSLDLPYIVLPHAEVGLRYIPETQAQQAEIVLLGKKLDAKWLQPKEIPLESEPEASQVEQPIKPKINHLQKLMRKKIDVRLQKLILREQDMRNFILNSNCAFDYCESLVLAADYGQDDHLNCHIRGHNDGKRHFTLQVSEIGSVIKAISGNQNFHGGSFMLSGIFDDKKLGKPLVGRFILQNVKLINTPILARLLTVASLSGIADILSGNGVSFDKISANINYTDDMILIEKGAAKGDALGIMFAGSLQPYEMQKVNIKGTIIPSYSLNSLPSEIPLVGELLTGGEGEGLFATNFSVRGILGDPDIMVNPLSMITPGFLRGVFEIFPDAKEKK
jgi:hypothetical protein